MEKVKGRNEALALSLACPRSRGQLLGLGGVFPRSDGGATDQWNYDITAPSFSVLSLPTLYSIYTLFPSDHFILGHSIDHMDYYSQLSNSQTKTS